MGGLWGAPKTPFVGALPRAEEAYAEDEDPQGRQEAGQDHRFGKRHLNWQKSGKEIRQKGRKFVLAKPEAERIKLLLPYE